MVLLCGSANVFVFSLPFAFASVTLASPMRYDLILSCRNRESIGIIKHLLLTKARIMAMTHQMYGFHHFLPSLRFLFLYFIVYFDRPCLI